MKEHIIAYIWDFDKTLIPEYMETPLFQHYGIKDEDFWHENNQLAEQYMKQGVHHVSKDTTYLNHILTYVHNGTFKGLNNQLLFHLGKQLTFHNGIPELLPRIKNYVAANTNGVHIKVEHYVISTGLYQMIAGSKVARYIDTIWANEFLDDEKKHELSQIALSLDGTSKTRAFFEINKGVNKDPSLDVNMNIPLEERRVPFSNMVYIADGPSDIPAFSVMNRNGGTSIAVYKPKSPPNYRLANQLYEQNRVHYIAEADYTEGSQIDLTLKTVADNIIAGITGEKKISTDIANKHILNEQVVV